VSILHPAAAAAQSSVIDVGRTRVDAVSAYTGLAPILRY